MLSVLPPGVLSCCSHKRTFLLHVESKQSSLNWCRFISHQKLPLRSKAFHSSLGEWQFRVCPRFVAQSSWKGTRELPEHCLSAGTHLPFSSSWSWIKETWSPLGSCPLCLYNQESFVLLQRSLYFVVVWDRISLWRSSWSKTNSQKSACLCPCLWRVGIKSMSYNSWPVLLS